MIPTKKETTPEDYFCDTPDSIREVRPFYWLMIVVMLILYVWALRDAPALRSAGRLIPFTALMLIHGGLHWLGPYLTTRRRWLLPYLIVQGGLAFGLTWIAGTPGLAFGLFLSLAGESVGILENVFQSTLAVAGYMLLAIADFVLLQGWSGLLGWLLVLAPMMFFVIVYVAMFLRQARARDRAQDLLHQLEVAHRQLEEYASQVERLTLAEERQRMARELHDTLAQGLAGLILQLEAADSHLAGGRDARAQEIVQQAMTRARATLAEARQAIGDLRASTEAAAHGAQGTIDLAQALKDEAERLRTAGIACHLSVPTSIDLRPELAEQVKRFVAEALTNAARHAHASQVWLEVEAARGELAVTVRDDGVGFDPSDAPAEPGHYGLVGLRERARLAGAQLDVQSHPGQGTQLRMRWPNPEALLA